MENFILTFKEEKKCFVIQWLLSLFRLSNHWKTLPVVLVYLRQSRLDILGGGGTRRAENLIKYKKSTVQEIWFIQCSLLVFSMIVVYHTRVIYIITCTMYNTKSGLIYLSIVDYFYNYKIAPVDFLSVYSTHNTTSHGECYNWREAIPKVSKCVYEQWSMR